MKEIVTFFLSGKEYGIEVNNMQGIENYRDIQSVEEMPDCLSGVVQIRDNIIPVINIKKRLILPPAGVTEDTKILVFRTIYGRLACVADGVSRIMKVEGDNEQKFPTLMQMKGTAYVDFVAKGENGLVIVIDPTNLLTEEEWEAAHKMKDSMEEKDD